MPFLKEKLLGVNGNAGIILDKTIIEALYTPVTKIWSDEGKDGPNISIIKLKPT